MQTHAGDRVLPGTLVEVRRDGTGTPIYFPPGALGEVPVTPMIGDALPENLPVYAFRQPLDAPLEASMEAMAARFWADLETVHPAGAVSLVAYSFAGLLAYDTGPDLSAGGGARGAATHTWLFLKNLPVWIY